SQTYFVLKVYYSFLLILGFLWSCNPISHNERLTVKGNVTDSSGNPISDIEIKTVSTTYRLGIDLTDTNGDFDFVSVASNRTEFDIWVNAKSWSDSQFYQEDYGSILYHFKNR